MLMVLLLIAAVPPAPITAAQPVEIVVTARRNRCRVRIADRLLSDRELAAKAEEWSKGTAVRIVAPERLGYKCLAKIASRLGARGVRLIEFVDAPVAP